MIGLSVVLLGSMASTGAGAGLRFDPPEPRLGDLVVVYADVGDPAIKEGALEAFGYEVVLHRVSKQSLRGFLAVPVDLAPGPHPVRAFIGGEFQTTNMVVKDRPFEATELSVSSRFTKRKSRKLRRRLAREQRVIQAIWDRAPSAPLAAGPFLRPVRSEVTGRFGSRRVFNGKTKSRHYGLDLDGKTGDPVHAVLAGRVVMSSLRFYSGGTIVIDHGSNLFSLYFHLSRRLVREGSMVNAGQRIGSVGRTGRVTGPHLHLALVVRSIYADGGQAGEARSMYVDPERALGLVLEADPAVLRPSKPKSKPEKPRQGRRKTDDSGRRAANP